MAKVMNLMKLMNFSEAMERRGDRAVTGLEIDTRHESARFQHQWHPLCVIDW